MALGFAGENLAASFRNKEHMTYEQFLKVIEGQTQGAVRVSLGLATTFSDVYRFMQFAQTFIDRSAPSVRRMTDVSRSASPTARQAFSATTPEQSAIIARLLNAVSAPGRHVLDRLGQLQRRGNERAVPSVRRRPMAQSTLSEREPGAS